MKEGEERVEEKVGKVDEIGGRRADVLALIS
jgi:hypothetical protein